MTSSTRVDIELNRIGGRSTTAAGVTIAILGLLAVAFRFGTDVWVSVVLGAVLTAGAFVHASDAFSAGALGSVLGQAQATLAVLYGFTGIAFIANPIVGLATVTLLAIAFFVADGVVGTAPDVPRGSQA